MCGVVATYAYGPSAPPIDRDEVRAVRDHMAARGPDGQGEWFADDGRVALAHRRLAIIDLSNDGAQPMRSADGSVVISFNGEIYNYRELRSQLERDGAVFRSGSDTEVLLHLYRRDGPAMLEQLRGMFAFALWDTREQALLLARDPFGIKPLYYADDGNTVRAASQVKALLKSAVDTRPDAAGHAGFWLWGSVPEPWTLYRGIRALPAGNFMWVRGGRCESPRSYCSVSDVLARATHSPAAGSRADAIEAIRAALQRSVAAHLVADVPVGVFLSSGIDSGMICADVTRAGVRPEALTLGFSEYAGTMNDEVPLAREIATRLGAVHNTVSLSRTDFEYDRDPLLQAMDQPSVDGVNTWFVAQAAASRGMKVALSGLGGDELFASYPSFHQVPRLARGLRPFAAVPGLGRALRSLSAPMLRQFTSPKFAGLLEYGGSIGGAYLLRRALFMPWELPSLLGDEMARDGWQALQTLPSLQGSAARFTRGPGGMRLAVSALEMSWYMRHQLLRDADWAGMAHSLEIRTPFADIALLRELAPWFAAHPDISKKDLADAVAPSLHEAWLKRPKTGFNVPIRQWLGARSKGSRGLRGWAACVYDTCAPSTVPRPAAARAGYGMKVLMLATDAFGGHGGIAFHNRCLAEALAKMPDVSEVVVVPRVMRFSAQQVPPKVRFLAHARGSKLRYMMALAPLAFEHFDLVVCGHLNLLAAAAPFAKLKNVPLVAQVYGIEAWRRPHRSTPFLLKQVDAVWSISNVTAERMSLWAALVPPSYRIIPCTFRAEHFGVAPRNEALVRKYGLEGRKVVMTLARLAGFERYKGIDEILEAMPALMQAYPGIVYMILGDGDDQARLQEKARTLGIASNVIFAGFVEEQHKADYLRLADVFALPGRGEGFGIVLLEALACGVPVVGSIDDGSREALLEGVLGELADPRSQESIQACLLRALAKPHRVPPELATFGWDAFQLRVTNNVRLVAAERGQRDNDAIPSGATAGRSPD
jgi:asparagine synthase (glutamine-hydrolysing)